MTPRELHEEVLSLDFNKLTESSNLDFILRYSRLAVKLQAFTSFKLLEVITKGNLNNKLVEEKILEGIMSNHCENSRRPSPEGFDTRYINQEYSWDFDKPDYGYTPIHIPNSADPDDVDSYVALVTIYEVNDN
jgi:hypothetical protein